MAKFPDYNISIYQIGRELKTSALLSRITHVH